MDEIEAIERSDAQEAINEVGQSSHGVSSVQGGDDVSSGSAVKRGRGRPRKTSVVASSPAVSAYESADISASVVPAEETTSFGTVNVDDQTPKTKGRKSKVSVVNPEPVSTAVEDESFETSAPGRLRSKIVTKLDTVPNAGYLLQHLLSNNQVESLRIPDTVRYTALVDTLQYAGLLDSAVPDSLLSFDASENSSQLSSDLEDNCSTHFNLSQHAVPDLLMVWELLRVLSPTIGLDNTINNIATIRARENVFLSNLCISSTSKVLAEESKDSSTLSPDLPDPVASEALRGLIDEENFKKLNLSENEISQLLNAGVSILSDSPLSSPEALAKAFNSPASQVSDTILPHIGVSLTNTLMSQLPSLLGLDPNNLVPVDSESSALAALDITRNLLESGYGDKSGLSTCPEMLESPKTDESMTTTSISLAPLGATPLPENLHPSLSAFNQRFDLSKSAAHTVTLDTWEEVTRRALLALSQQSIGARSQELFVDNSQASAQDDDVEAEADGDSALVADATESRERMLAGDVGNLPLHTGAHVLRWFGLTTLDAVAAEREELESAKQRLLASAENTRQADAVLASLPVMVSRTLFSSELPESLAPTHPDLGIPPNPGASEGVGASGGADEVSNIDALITTVGSGHYSDLLYTLHDAYEHARLLRLADPLLKGLRVPLLFLPRHSLYPLIFKKNGVSASKLVLFEPRYLSPRVFEDFKKAQQERAVRLKERVASLATTEDPEQLGRAVVSAHAAAHGLATAAGAVSPPADILAAVVTDPSDELVNSGPHGVTPVEGDNSSSTPTPFTPSSATPTATATASSTALTISTTTAPTNEVLTSPLAVRLPEDPDNLVPDIEHVVAVTPAPPVELVVPSDSLSIAAEPPVEGLGLALPNESAVVPPSLRLAREKLARAYRLAARAARHRAAARDTRPPTLREVYFAVLGLESADGSVSHARVYQLCVQALASAELELQERQQAWKEAVAQFSQDKGSNSKMDTQSDSSSNSDSESNSESSSESDSEGAVLLEQPSPPDMSAPLRSTSYRPLQDGDSDSDSNAQTSTPGPDGPGSEQDELAKGEAFLAPLRALLTILGGLLGRLSEEDEDEYIQATEEAVAAANLPRGRGRPSRPRNKQRSINIRRVSLAEQERLRKERSAEEQLVLPAGRLRDALLFVLRRYLRANFSLLVAMLAQREDCPAQQLYSAFDDASAPASSPSEMENASVQLGVILNPAIQQSYLNEARLYRPETVIMDRPQLLLALGQSAAPFLLSLPSNVSLMPPPLTFFGFLPQEHYGPSLAAPELCAGGLDGLWLWNPSRAVRTALAESARALPPTALRARAASPDFFLQSSDVLASLLACRVEQGRVLAADGKRLPFLSVVTLDSLPAAAKDKFTTFFPSGASYTFSVDLQAEYDGESDSTVSKLWYPARVEPRECGAKVPPLRLLVASLRQADRYTLLAHRNTLISMLNELHYLETLRRIVAQDLPHSADFYFPLDAELNGLDGYAGAVRRPCDLRSAGQRLAASALVLLDLLSVVQHTLSLVSPNSEEAHPLTQAQIELFSSGILLDQIDFAEAPSAPSSSLSSPPSHRYDSAVNGEFSYWSRLRHPAPAPAAHRLPQPMTGALAAADERLLHSLNILAHADSAARPVTSRTAPPESRSIVDLAYGFYAGYGRLELFWDLRRAFANGVCFYFGEGLIAESGASLLRTLRATALRDFPAMLAQDLPLLRLAGVDLSPLRPLKDSLPLIEEPTCERRVKLTGVNGRRVRLRAADSLEFLTLDMAGSLFLTADEAPPEDPPTLGPRGRAVVLPMLRGLPGAAEEAFLDSLGDPFSPHLFGADPLVGARARAALLEEEALQRMPEELRRKEERRRKDRMRKSQANEDEKDGPNPVDKQLQCFFSDLDVDSPRTLKTYLRWPSRRSFGRNRYLKGCLMSVSLRLGQMGLSSARKEVSYAAAQVKLLLDLVRAAGERAEQVLVTTFRLISVEDGVAMQVTLRAAESQDTESISSTASLLSELSSFMEARTTNVDSEWSGIFKLRAPGILLPPSPPAYSLERSLGALPGSLRAHPGPAPPRALLGATSHLSFGHSVPTGAGDSRGCRACGSHADAAERPERAEPRSLPSKWDKEKVNRELKALRGTQEDSAMETTEDEAETSTSAFRREEESSASESDESMGSPSPSQPPSHGAKDTELVKSNEEAKSMEERKIEGDDPMTLLLCDGCDSEMHLGCVRPRLTRIPSGIWLCPGCLTEGCVPEAVRLQVQSGGPGASSLAVVASAQDEVVSSGAVANGLYGNSSDEESAPSGPTRRGGHKKLRRGKKGLSATPAGIQALVKGSGRGRGRKIRSFFKNCAFFHRCHPFDATLTQPERMNVLLLRALRLGAAAARPDWLRLISSPLAPTLSTTELVRFVKNGGMLEQAVRGSDAFDPERNIVKLTPFPSGAIEAPAGTVSNAHVVAEASNPLSLCRNFTPPLQDVFREVPGSDPVGVTVSVASTLPGAGSSIPAAANAAASSSPRSDEFDSENKAPVTPERLFSILNKILAVPDVDAEGAARFDTRRLQAPPATVAPASQLPSLVALEASPMLAVADAPTRALLRLAALLHTSSSLPTQPGASAMVGGFAGMPPEVRLALLARLASLVAQSAAGQHLAESAAAAGEAVARRVARLRSQRPARARSEALAAAGVDMQLVMLAREAETAAALQPEIYPLSLSVRPPPALRRLALVLNRGLPPGALEAAILETIAQATGISSLSGGQSLGQVLQSFFSSGGAAAGRAKDGWLLQLGPLRLVDGVPRAQKAERLERIRVLSLLQSLVPRKIRIFEEASEKEKEKDKEKEKEEEKEKKPKARKSTAKAAADADSSAVDAAAGTADDKEKEKEETDEHRPLSSAELEAQIASLLALIGPGGPTAPGVPKKHLKELDRLRKAVARAQNREAREAAEQAAREEKARLRQEKEDIKREAAERRAALAAEKAERLEKAAAGAVQPTRASARAANLPRRNFADDDQIIVSSPQPMQAGQGRGKRRRSIDADLNEVDTSMTETPKADSGNVTEEEQHTVPASTGGADEADSTLPGSKRPRSDSQNTGNESPSRKQVNLDSAFASTNDRDSKMSEADTTSAPNSETVEVTRATAINAVTPSESAPIPIVSLLQLNPASSSSAVAASKSNTNAPSASAPVAASTSSAAPASTSTPSASSNIVPKKKFADDAQLQQERRRDLQRVLQRASPAADLLTGSVYSSTVTPDESSLIYRNAANGFLAKPQFSPLPLVPTSGALASLGLQSTALPVPAQIAASSCLLGSTTDLADLEDVAPLDAREERMLAELSDEGRAAKRQVMALPPPWSLHEAGQLVRCFAEEALRAHSRSSKLNSDLETYLSTVEGPDPLLFGLSTDAWLRVLQRADINPARNALDCVDFLCSLFDAQANRIPAAVSAGARSGPLLASLNAIAAAYDAQCERLQTLFAAAGITPGSGLVGGSAASEIPTISGLSEEEEQLRLRFVHQSSLSFAPATPVLRELQALGLVPYLPSGSPPPRYRYCARARALLRSKATLHWEASLLRLELLQGALGARTEPLGRDARGRDYFVIGALASSVFVRSLPPSQDVASLRAQYGSRRGQFADAELAQLDGLARRLGTEEISSSVLASQFLADSGEVWHVVDTPQALDALIAGLNSFSESEGPLHAALMRRRGLLLAAMFSAKKKNEQEEPAPQEIPQTSEPVTPPPHGPNGDCAFCGFVPPKASVAAVVHCHVCHVSFPVGAAPQATHAKFVKHVAQCLQSARSRPMDLFVAGVSALSAGQSMSDSEIARLLADNLVCSKLLHLLSSSKDAEESPLEVDAVELSKSLSTQLTSGELLPLFDPRLMRCKRTLVALLLSLNCSRLRDRGQLTPAMRASLAHAASVARNARELMIVVARLENVLRADDLCGRFDAQNEPDGCVAPPGDQWLPHWYLETVARADVVAKTAPTLPVVVSRLMALETALNERLLLEPNQAPVEEVY